MIFHEFDDYQKIIMTHDRGFFNIVQSKIDIASWSMFELRSHNSTINLIRSDRELDRAKDCLKNGDLEICGLLLRKKLERITQEYLTKRGKLSSGFKSLHKLLISVAQDFDKNFLDQFSQQMYNNKLSLEDIGLLRTNFMSNHDIPDDKKELLSKYYNKLLGFVEDLYKKKDHFHYVFIELTALKSRIFNPAAHFAPETPLYRKELEDAVKVIEKLDAIINNPCIEKLQRDYKVIRDQLAIMGNSDCIIAASQAIDKTFDCIKDTIVPLDQVYDHILSCLGPLDAENLVRIFDDLSTHRLDEIRSSGIDHFILSLLRERQWNDQEKAAIRAFLADLMNENVAFGKRVNSSLRRSGLIPIWEGDEHHGE